MIFRLIIIGLILGIALFTMEAFSQGTWQVKESSAAKVHYRRGEAENANLVLASVEDNLAEVTEKLEVRLPYKPQIYLTTSQAEFDRITGGFLPEWSQGVSSARTGTIILKSPETCLNEKLWLSPPLHGNCCTRA